MDNLKLQRIRELIIASHSVGEDGDLSFDITIASSLGFTSDEIEEGIRIVAAEQTEILQDYFKHQINFCFPGGDPFSVYHIGYAKLIFSMNHEKQAYSYITEEELENKVQDMKDFIVKLQYTNANSNNDAFGSAI